MPGQLPLGIGLPDAARFSTFHPGGNAVVLETLEGLALGKGERVVWLAGSAGSGKTHLLQASCAACTGAGRRAALLPLRELDPKAPDILEGWESHDLVCIDDLDEAAGREEWEHALFALYNALAAQGGSWLASGRDVPSAIGCRLPDLASRLSAGPVYALRPLDDAGRLAALKLRANQRGFELPDEAGSYLLKRVPRDMNTLYAVLEKLDRVTLLQQRRVTVPLVREILDEGAGLE